MSNSSESRNLITVGLVQMAMSDDAAANLRKAVEGIQSAAQRGAKIVCLPELFRTPYFCINEKPSRDYREEVPGESGRELSRVAGELGIVVVGSGLVLDKLVPGLAYLRSDMQLAHMIHSVSAVLVMVVFALHIYLGTVGVRGAWRAMRDGYVDDAWAREHHALWHQDIEAGRIPAQRTSDQARGRPAVQQP